MDQVKTCSTCNKCNPKVSCQGCLIPLSEYEIDNYYTIDYTEETDCHFQQCCKECYFALIRCQSQITRAQLIVKPDEPDMIDENYKTSFVCNRLNILLFLFNASFTSHTPLFQLIFST